MGRLAKVKLSKRNRVNCRSLSQLKLDRRSCWMRMMIMIMIIIWNMILPWLSTKMINISQVRSTNNTKRLVNRIRKESKTCLFRMNI